MKAVQPDKLTCEVENVENRGGAGPQPCATSDFEEDNKLEAAMRGTCAIAAAAVGLGAIAALAADPQAVGEWIQT